MSPPANPRGVQLDLEGAIEQLAGNQSATDTLEALVDLIKCGGDDDYASLPALGKLIVSLHEIDITTQMEGLAHYFLYCGDRWQGLIVFLETVGAKRKARIIESVIHAFPDHLLPSDQSSRIELLTEYEKTIEAAEVDWRGDTQALGDAVKLFLQAHQEDLVALLTDRLQAGRQSQSHRVPGPANLPVILKQAAEKDVERSTRATRFLYAIAAAVASNPRGFKPSDHEELRRSIASATQSTDHRLREWAFQAEAALREPDPEAILKWIGDALRH